ncbi:hypothetical protein SK3146_05020 [Paenibacillus konkukensis]|uniref:Secreted protein n=1 Tax=Paenibacillus konkukensis TaxID=2020716 RepID=A0ABY4RT21_9BACL|nr:hypothetical protein [Paenibacillus konkukensis]UQZ85731.1 hypothetical protein SK3146_05020 [Paenibacillus konkukensis]
MNKKHALSLIGALVVGVVGGVGLMMNDSAYGSVKEALGGQATQNAIGKVDANGTLTVQVSNMDLETALMQVQSQRADLLDQQLKQQMEEVQKRNELIMKMNDMLSELRSLRPQKAGDTAAVPAGLKSKLAEASITVSGDKLTQAEFDALLDKLRGSIDSASNSQQMDMLRLQSLTNKRNEAFDTMSNFIKKMQDSRSSIIGNMR